MNRRTFLHASSLTSASVLSSSIWTQDKSEVKVLNPRNRIPINFIIDDSTALVNMAYFGIPQFKEVFPDRYLQDWRSLPREIPDSFVMEFLEWCDLRGVKGKYSMVPFPACTGWLHRFIPGWTKKELEASLKIVRDLASPNWDIHSEMISHTRVIDTKSGLPFPEATPDWMENWEWSQSRSGDELGEYIAYSLQILKEAGFDCDGVTTPGGFGHRNIPNLAAGTKNAVHEVFGHRVAHFFRDVITEPGKSVEPQIFHATDLDSDHASCAVHIIACTGDWFGGWDGLTPGDPDKFITPDGSGGRMVEVIDAGQPAVFICHWPGIYYNGEKLGFEIFKTVVDRLQQKYDHLLWMKLTEIAHYWAAKEYAQFQKTGHTWKIYSPFPTTNFTIECPGKPLENAVLKYGQHEVRLQQVTDIKALSQNSWTHANGSNYVCFELPVGNSEIS